MARIYADELSRGADIIRRAVLASQVRKAVDGNTPAANFVMRQLDRGEAEGVYRAPVAKVERLGKKEQRQLDAEQVGGGIFAPGAPPPRLAH